MNIVKAWSLHPTGIVAKFTGGVAVLLLLFTLLAVHIQGRLDEARGAVAAITEIEYRRSGAAFEMEINTIGTGLAVVQYLQRPDPVHKARVKKG